MWRMLTSVLMLSGGSGGPGPPRCATCIGRSARIRPAAGPRTRRTTRSTAAPTLGSTTTTAGATPTTATPSPEKPACACAWKPRGAAASATPSPAPPPTTPAPATCAMMRRCFRRRTIPGTATCSRPTPAGSTSSACWSRRRWRRHGWRPGGPGASVLVGSPTGRPAPRSTTTRPGAMWRTLRSAPVPWTGAGGSGRRLLAQLGGRS
mmetsp:Transcript_59942/g.160560  ORF Transcript_59942/g.160560 Transcript_59942/m.160560 type:complete len:207 (-) Transcript_59942:950-1570(-)